MGKKNSKLKQDTVDRLIAETYCKYIFGHFDTELNQIKFSTHVLKVWALGPKFKKDLSARLTSAFTRITPAKYAVTVHLYSR